MHLYREDEQGGRKWRLNTGEYGFRHCVVASTWAFEAQGPGSIPGGGATSLQSRQAVAEQLG